MKEFKKGDTVALLFEVLDCNGRSTDPIRLKRLGDNDIHAVEYSVGDYCQNVFHIEDIAPKPEFPKWMMVGDNAIMDNLYVIARHPNGTYIAIADAKTDSQLLTSDGTRCWKYAIDIPIKSIDSIKKEKLMTEIEALKLQVEKLEIQANKL